MQKKDFDIWLFVLDRNNWNYTYISNIYVYLPTPPLGQDMRQGQFISGV